MTSLAIIPAQLLPEPESFFRNRYYFRLNQRRFEHLAQLGLPLHGRRILEVGAGIGDHTPFFLDRGCRVTVTEGRPENIAYLRRRYENASGVDIQALDLDEPGDLVGGPWDVVYCYGVLYHLLRPAEAIAALAPLAGDMLLLETVCALGDGLAVNLVDESSLRASQSLRGTGCRPTRAWVMEQLRSHFPHVWTTARQPFHPEFPNDWSPQGSGELVLGRAVFVASRHDLALDSLVSALPDRQERC